MLELHVDDCHGTSKPGVIKRCLQYLEKHIELKWVGGTIGNVSYDFLKSRRTFKNDTILTIPTAMYLKGALARHDLSATRKGAVSWWRKKGDE